MHTREMMKTIFVNLLKREDSQELLNAMNKEINKGFSSRELSGTTSNINNCQSLQ